MKNATLILAAVTAFVLSACARGPATGKPQKQNTAFSWLSTTSVPQTVSR